jgi:DNA-cytosine methyltransferase
VAILVFHEELGDGVLRAGSGARTCPPGGSAAPPRQRKIRTLAYFPDFKRSARALTKKRGLRRLRRNARVSDQAFSRSVLLGLEIVGQSWFPSGMTLKNGSPTSSVGATGALGGPETSLVSPHALARWAAIYVVEDNSKRASRRQAQGLPRARGASDVVLRIHEVTRGGVSTVMETRYLPGRTRAVRAKHVRAALTLSLLDELEPRERSVVVAGPNYGSSAWFRSGLDDRGFEAVLAVKPSVAVTIDESVEPGEHPLRDLLSVEVEWSTHQIRLIGSSDPVDYAVATLGAGRIGDDHGLIFAAQKGGIGGLHPGTTFGFAQRSSGSPEELLEAVGWTDWIRSLVRRSERPTVIDGSRTRRARRSASEPIRANITIARQHDEARDADNASISRGALKGSVASGSSTLNVVELFAGAGGMGLGFLLAGSGTSSAYRLVSSAEVHPIYVRTLVDNHAAFERLCPGAPEPRVPEETVPTDLRLKAVRRRIASQVREAGGVDVLVGGPPCQGFSNANRNSWHGANPHNTLVQVFLRYLKELSPRVFLLENVQGLHWTAATARRSMLEHIERRAHSAGYQVFVKLLDAVWYGTPQYRSRFFVLGLHRDLGYSADDFGTWGPFPTPTHGPGARVPHTTVLDAISDLPILGNGVSYNGDNYVPRSRGSGAFLREMRHGVAGDDLTDHVTSRHADYVIERYQKIPPGGNWNDIRDQLTNYADVRRTHSNIYRRLVWGEPSITIGHYRKSMLVHPSQHRGLSLREACRLQSFPDWFRFAGTPSGEEGGLVHKQQQLANAVCPLVTRAIADYILAI